MGDVVLMAEIAGLDATEWAARAIVDDYAKEPAKQAALASALKKAFQATGAGIVLSGVNGAAQAGETLSHFIRCLLWKRSKSFISFNLFVKHAANT